MKRLRLSVLRSPKIWQRTGFGIALLASLVAAVYLVENYRGEAAWERYRAEATARGVELDFRAFIPPPLPDEENFAKALLFEELRSTDPNVRTRAEDSIYLPRGTGVPYAWAVGKGVRPDLAAWQTYFVQQGFVPAATESAAADVLAAMERYEPALAQLREAANRPDSRLDAGWEKGFRANFFGRGKWAFGTLRLTEVLNLRIAALLALDRKGEAMADWRLFYHLHALFRAEPTLLVGMLRVMLVATAVNTAWQGLATQQWGAEELRELEMHLATVDLMADHRFAMASERSFQNSFIFEPIKSLPWEKRPHFLKSFDGRASNSWSWRGLLPLGWFYQNQVRMNQWHDRYLARIDGNLPQPRSSNAIAQESARSEPTWLFHPYSFLSDEVLLGLGGALADVRTSQSDVQLCRVVCALERFHNRHGSYPQTLDDLVPSEIVTLPFDAFAQPLRYRQSGGSFILYSLGSNRSDDGGAKDDLAWRSPPRPALKP